MTADPPPFGHLPSEGDVINLGVGNAVPGVPAGAMLRLVPAKHTFLPPSAVGTPGTAFPTHELMTLP